MQLFSSGFFPAAAMLLALAAWLSLAVTNNIRDPGTNRHLLGQMFRMELLRGDPHMGQGLLHRASADQRLPEFVLRLVIVVQLALAAALWLAGLGLLAAWAGAIDQRSAVGGANLALAGFMGLWTFFLCGGMWFGYWMKTPQVQQVHLALFVIALLGFLVVGAARP